jgi:hypothetical protein
MTYLTEIVDTIKKFHFPSSKQDLIDQAEDMHLSNTVITMMNKLPDKTYDSPTQVVDAARGLI